MRTGRWKRVLPDIFVIAEITWGWDQALTAASLWLEERRHPAAFTGPTAAVLWGLDGFLRSSPIRLIASARVRSPRAWLIVHQTVRLLPNEIVRLRGLPVTCIERTLLELCRQDADLAELALEDALRKGLTRQARLEWMMGLSPGFRGVRTFSDQMAARKSKPPTGSRLEIAFERFLRRHGLPMPIRQFVIKANGRFIARPDFFYSEANLAVELQSKKHHFGTAEWARDMERVNVLAELGIRVLLVTHEDMKRKEMELRDRLRRLLGIV